MGRSTCAGLLAAWRVPGRFALVVLLTAGLAAAQLLPVFDLFAHSQRDVGFGDAEWAMPIHGLANFLVPLFRCSRSFHGVFVQAGQYWTTSYYLGVGVVLLAVLAIGRVRERNVGLLAVVAGLGLLLAMGDQGFLYGWLRKLVPQFGFMRFPIKFVVLPVFVLPLLAAYGVRWYRELPEVNSHLRCRRMLLVALALLGLILVIAQLAHAYSKSEDNWTATWQNAFVRALFLMLITAALLTLHYARRTRWQGIVGLALLAALWFDVRTHAPNLNPTVERSVYDPGLVRSAAKFVPEPNHGGARVMVSPAALSRMRHLSVPTAKDEMLGRRLALYGNCNLLDDIPKLNGFYSLYLREADQVLSLLYPSPKTDLPRLIDFLNVAHVTKPDGLLEWVARPSLLPLVTAGQKPVFADDPATLTALQEPAFDPQSIVYLPWAAASAITATNPTAAKVMSSRFTAHRAEIEVDASEPSWVVVAQAYYLPWQAYVDNAPTRLWRANYAFQAVEVPAGRHEVKLVYRDWNFYLGVMISTITLLGCVMGWVCMREQPGIPLGFSSGIS